MAVEYGEPLPLKSCACLWDLVWFCGDFFQGFSRYSALQWDMSSGVTLVFPETQGSGNECNGQDCIIGQSSGIYLIRAA
eukprot:c30210_g1_i1 orf=1-234(-)